MKWSTNSPFRAAEGQIRVYAGSKFPVDPTTDTKARVYDDVSVHDWDTGLHYGSGWRCAYIGQVQGNKSKYAYMIQIVME